MNPSASNAVEQIALRRRRMLIFVLILLVYGGLLLPALFVEGYLDSPIGVLLLLPYLSVYLLHQIGIPGLLQNGGMCGWGWCAPTLAGWLLVALVWLALLWLLVCLGVRRRQT